MSNSAAQDVQPPEGLRAEVAAKVAEEGHSWFPTLGPGPLRLQYRSGMARARCFLYRFEVGDGHLSRSIMVKVRHFSPDLRRLDRVADRPVLAPVGLVSDEETARREYDGLKMIADALRDADPARFGVLTPRAWLPGHAAIVTEVVEEPTLRTELLRASRLRPGRRTALEDTPWCNAGAWLRLYHGQPTSLDLLPRGETPAEVGELLQQFADFLRSQLGGRPVLEDLSSSGPEIARQALPEELPLAAAHGDFTATNIFTGLAGRVTVFDPLPMWRIAVYQDLATLLVGLRVHPLQASTQGLALSRTALDRYEAALLRGYFGAEPVPYRAVAVFQLLALLDRWAALVSQRSVRRGRLRSRVQEARVALASRHYEVEARRLHRAAVAP